MGDNTVTVAKSGSEKATFETDDNGFPEVVFEREYDSTETEITIEISAGHLSVERNGELQGEVGFGALADLFDDN